MTCKEYRRLAHEACQPNIGKLAVITLVYALINGLINVEYKDHIENRIKQICNLVSPWITTNANVKTHDDIIFAMNPKAYAKLPDASIISALLKDKGNVSYRFCRRGRGSIGCSNSRH